VSVTEVPDVKLAVQVVGQLIPAGLLVIVPVPLIATVNWKLFGGGGLVPELAPQAVSTKARETAKPANRKLTRRQPQFGTFLGAKQSSWVACCWMA
jgi:hypothetical protein